MPVLLTGAFGGVGKSLEPFFRDRYQENIYLVSRSKREGAHTCDLSNFESTINLISELKPDKIFHFAGSATNDLEYDFNQNCLPTKNIFEALIKTEISARVFVMGSASEYGIVTPAENPVSESHRGVPASVYGITKNMQTEICRFYHQKFNQNVVVGRLFNFMSMGLSESLFLGRLEQQIASFKDGKIKFLEFGNLSSERDYIGPDEAFNLVALIFDKGMAGEVYNIGTGKPQLIRDVLNHFLGSNGIGLESVKFGKNTKTKQVDLPIIYADMKKTLLLRDQ